MKYLITVLIVFCFTALHAQTEQNFILSTQIGYSYTYEDKADYSTFSWESMQLTDRKINDFNFSIAIGRRIHTNFYYGLGIAWNTRKTEINPNADRPLTGISPGFSVSYNRSNNVTERNVISPMVYLQYFMSLSERMHFTLDLVSLYDFVNTTDKSTRHLFEPVFPGFDAPYYNPVIINSDHNELDQQFFNIGIHPGFRLNLYKSFGMNVAFGAVAYRIKTADSRLPDMDFKKSREFNVRFTPENWRMGFHLTF